MRTRLTAGLGVLAAAGMWSLMQGCGSSAPPPPPPATGSGAFGVVTVGGKQELFLPLKDGGGDGQIAVVDVGVAGTGVNDAGTPALITDIDLGSVGIATATAGDATVVVAAGTMTYNVWFINPATNKVTDILQLDPGLSEASFSGGQGIVNGIAIDEANHRAILSVWNGLIFVDLGSHTVTGSILAAGAENIGYDSSLEYVLSPFYNCESSPSTGDMDGGYATPPPCSSYMSLGDAGQTITDGLNLINLKTGAVYTFEDSDAGAPSAPVGLEPDSAAVDPTTGLCMVSSEENNFYSFIDLSKAVFGFIGDAGIFTAPLTLRAPSDGVDWGVSIEPTSHLAFTEQEFGSHVSVLELGMYTIGDGGGNFGYASGDAGGDFGPGAFADGFLPDLPDGNNWINLGDPHGIAVTTGILTGDPVGFVVTDQNANGDVWVARIDLNMMLTLGTKAGMTMSAEQFAPAITLLDATRKE